MLRRIIITELLFVVVHRPVASVAGLCQHVHLLLPLVPRPREEEPEHDASNKRNHGDRAVEVDQIRIGGRNDWKRKSGLVSLKQALCLLNALTEGLTQGRRQGVGAVVETWWTSRQHGRTPFIPSFSSGQQAYRKQAISYSRVLWCRHIQGQ